MERHILFLQYAGYHYNPKREFRQRFNPIDQVRISFFASIIISMSKNFFSLVRSVVGARDSCNR